MSIFLEPNPDLIPSAVSTGTDRIELYTESFANQFEENPLVAVKPFVDTAAAAYALGLGVNAGHDLNLENLHFFASHVPQLEEVSIGHALIGDALYLGLQETIRRYKACLIV